MAVTRPTSRRRNRALRQSLAAFAPSSHGLHLHDSNDLLRAFAAAHAARADVRGEPVRLSGAQPPLGRDVDRRESESRQDLQLRLHLLPGRSHAAERDAGSSRSTQLLDELDSMLRLVAVGRDLSRREKFRDTPPALRRLNDIAFSGDGEPTTYRNFDEIIAACAEVKRRHGLDDVKMVLITNASMFHRPHVAARAGDPRRQQRRNLGQARSRHRRVLSARRAHADPVPADSGQHHRRRTRAAAGDSRRCSCGSNGEPPSQAELEAFCDRLNEITAAGGQLKLVQIYTVARRPAESYVTPLPAEEVDAIAALVAQRTALPTAAFYGPTS